MRRLRSAAAALLTSLAIGACAAPPTPLTPTSVDSPTEPMAASDKPAPTPTPVAPSAEDDLARLLSSLETTHPAPFHGIERAAFVDALSAYENRLPELTAEESVVELMRVWALLSRNGRDGHQFALPAAGHAGPMLPLRVYEFDEGVFVTDALPPHEDLAGSRIVAIDGHPIEDVLAEIEPLVPRDGPATVPAFRPILLLRGIVLRGLGLIGEGSIELSVEDASGSVRSVSLDLVDADAHGDWAGPFGHQLPARGGTPYLAQSEPFTVSRLHDDRTLYLRYRFVTGPSTALAREAVEAGGVERLVLDLRQNPGGDNGTYRTLLAFIREYAGAHPGSTFVLTDRVTFSAASNLATEIEQTTDAVFIGEAMAGAPNFWDDVVWVDLPALPVPMRAAVSTRYWEKSTPEDPRFTIEPDIAIVVTAADYFADRDPVLDAVGGAPIP